ncbi:MAG: hypothetical protein M1508_09735 [Nitrospirae bacterium]|nr:hypothetical protein [Nitrospirota bacterium]MCL5422201.1 hypothetical protein [Nitrospirota bacterium]
MTKAIKTVIAISLSIALLSFQAGCAARAAHPYQLPPPLSEEERARLGTMGVVSANFVPEAMLFTYARGRVSGAAKGMVFEAGMAPPLFVPGGAPSAPPGAGAGFAAGAAVLLGLIIVGVMIGEAYRAATAIPAEEVKEIESNLTKALIELKMQESFKERFFQMAREQSALNLVLIEEGGPKASGETLNYGHLKEKNIDTVVELSVLSIGFEGEGGKDPLLSLLIDVRTRLLSVSDGAVLYENKLEYRSAKRKFTQWIADEGKLFSEELDRGYGTLSEKIVEELFLLYDFTAKKAPERKTEHAVREKGKA